MSIKKCLLNVIYVLPFVIVCGVVGFTLHMYITVMYSISIILRLIFSVVIVSGIVDIFKMYKLTKELIRLNNMK